MNLRNFIDGLTTLRNYYENQEGYHIGAGHDQFYAYQTDKPLTPEDQQKMCALGWFQPEGGMSEDGGEYDPENGWSAVT
jgi:hypothetical protein